MLRNMRSVPVLCAVAVAAFIGACSGRSGGDSVPADAGSDAPTSDGAGGDAAPSDAAADAPDAVPADSGIDCSLVGCGPPPLCATGCQEVCGCCSCAEGEIQGALFCQGGCFVPLDPEG